MGRLNNDEQFKFLISCIRYSNNGKVDFAEVAKECSIVTKGAAAKRYERMMKAHGIHQPSNSPRDAFTTLPQRKDESYASTSTRKKRKVSPSSHSSSDSGDVYSNKKLKNEEEHQSQFEDTAVKDEAKQLGGPEGTDCSWLNFSQDSMSQNVEDSAFTDFLNPSVFEPVNGSDSLAQRHCLQQTLHTVPQHELPTAAAGGAKKEKVVVVD